MIGDKTGYEENERYCGDWVRNIQTRIIYLFSFSTNFFLDGKALPKELQSFLAQVLSRRKKVFCKKKIYIHIMRRFSVQHLHARAEGKNANTKREAVKCLNQNLQSPIA